MLDVVGYVRPFLGIRREGRGGLGGAFCCWTYCNEGREMGFECLRVVRHGVAGVP